MTLSTEAENLLCFGARIGAVTQSVSATTKWFDYLESPGEMHWDGRLEISLTEFPDATFRWYPEKMEAVTEEKINPLYTGMPIWNTYFCDLTGDGLPELCSSLSIGSGMIDNRVIIYDYANGASYSLEDRGVFDYTLRQNESDGGLYVDKSSHSGGDVVASGRLAFQDDCLQVLWSGTPNAVIVEIIDLTDDPNFAYDTAIEKIYEDEANEYFIGGLYSQHIIVLYSDGTQEDIAAALNNGRATMADLDQFDIAYWAQPKEDQLYRAVLNAICDRNRSEKTEELLHCASFVLLDQKDLSGTPAVGSADHTKTVTVYGLALYQGYELADGRLQEQAGSHIPVAITFEVTDGEYVLEDYWIPRDGTYYASDIRDIFPDDIEDEALDTQKYVLAQKQECYDQAVRQGNVDTALAIEQLFEIVESSPATSSVPADYLAAHPVEYRELTYYGSYTLRYIFSQFLQGNQTGLRGHLMRSVLDDLAPEAQLRIPAETGQDYFEEWKAAAVRAGEQHDMDWLQENLPAVWLLLQMIDE